MAKREYTNTDVHSRVWPDLQVEDGGTLELAPRESVELDLPDAFNDPHLKSKRRKDKPTEISKPELTKQPDQKEEPIK